MGPFRCYCAVCGHPLDVEAALAGSLIECPVCERMVPIPGLRAPADWSDPRSGVFPPEILAVEIKFPCAACGAKLRIDARWEGRDSECPVCREKVRIPRWSRNPNAEPAAAMHSAAPSLTQAEVDYLSDPSVPCGPPAKT